MNKLTQKYFDANGNEVDPAKAVRCHELELDEKGRVVKDSVYNVVQPNSAEAQATSEG